MTTSKTKDHLTRRLYNLGLSDVEIADLTGRSVGRVRQMSSFYKGREFDRKVRELRDRGMSVRDVAKTMNCSTATVYEIVPVIKDKIAIPRWAKVRSSLWDKLTLNQQKWMLNELRRTGDMDVILLQLIPSACPDSVRTSE